jgi:membrane protein YdbS with pleckstrin-like domain
MPPALTDDQVKALWRVGYVRPVDFILLLAVSFTGIVAFFWWFFGQPATVNMLCCAVTAMFLIQLWLVLLVYRAMRFVLDIIAELKLLPETAARLALQMATKTPQ